MIYPITAFVRFFESIGLYFLLQVQLIRSIPSWPKHLGLLLDQMIIIGANSIPIIIVTSIFSGMVTAVQSAYQFSSFIPDYFVGSVVGESILLELAPVITGLVLTGRVGATIAAELGTMRVTEQIDALESLSFNPISFLVFPRVIAGTIMLPFLIIIADFFGIAGGMLSAYLQMDVSYYDFIKGFRQWFQPLDAWFGLIKALAFGYTITSIACFQGYYASGGAQGVGKATTITVVVSCIAIVFLDYVLAALIL
ncbi:MAG: ABC transporter permease [FCB group bacterium]|nr:ABC transporter permease [FCB group bacterium]